MEEEDLKNVVDSTWLSTWLVPWLMTVTCDLCIFSRAGLLDLGTINTWGQIILYCEDRPVLCKMFSSIPGLCPLDASSTSP